MYKMNHEVIDISACCVKLVIDIQSDEINVMTKLFVQIIESSFFLTLRTKFVFLKNKFIN